MKADSDLIASPDESSLPSSVTGRVLVVDDELKSRELLKAILEASGHEVLEAIDGQDAMDQLADSKRGLPDLILLDIIMPRLSGYETCRKIKGNPKTEHIPVIVVTALADRDNRLRAIGEGANDLLIKPFDAAEVALRVGNGIASKQLFDRVSDDFYRLRELEEVRDRLVHMIVHDLRQPLTALRGYIDYLISIDQAGSSVKMLQSMKGAAERMGQMIASLLDIQKLEEGKMALSFVQCDLIKLIHTVTERYTGPSSSNVSIKIEAAEPSVEAVCDRELITRVVSNLVDNAARHAPKDSIVKMRLVCEADHIRVAVIDSGPGIPKEHHSRIFEKFGQVSLHSEGHRQAWGLGLTFCKMAVEAHGGTIGVVSEPGNGSTFWFTLPQSHGKPPGA